MLPDPVCRIGLAGHGERQEEEANCADHPTLDLQMRRERNLSALCLSGMRCKFERLQSASI